MSNQRGLQNVDITETIGDFIFCLNALKCSVSKLMKDIDCALSNLRDICKVRFNTWSILFRNIFSQNCFTGGSFLSVTARPPTYQLLPQSSTAVFRFELNAEPAID